MEQYNNVNQESCWLSKSWMTDQDFDLSSCFHNFFLLTLRQTVHTIVLQLLPVKICLPTHREPFEGLCNFVKLAFEVWEGDHYWHSIEQCLAYNFKNLGSWNLSSFMSHVCPSKAPETNLRTWRFCSLPIAEIWSHGWRKLERVNFVRFCGRMNSPLQRVLP